MIIKANLKKGERERFFLSYYISTFMNENVFFSNIKVFINNKDKNERKKKGLKIRTADLDL